MFDIGGWEFLLIAILGIIIIGPRELPGAIRSVGAVMRKARTLAREFQSGLEEVAREAELDKVTETMKTATDPVGRVRREILDSVDPDEHVKDALNFGAAWTDGDVVEYEKSEFIEDNKIAASEKQAKSDTAYVETKHDETTEPEKPV